MKCILTFFLVTLALFLGGCETFRETFLYTTASPAVCPGYIPADCCKIGKYESGYFYNGYQETGWRFCIKNCPY